MGLLGNGWNDPNSAAIMALAGNMVRGGLNGGFGGGLLAAQDAYQNTQDSVLKRQDVAQQIQLRNLQLQQAQEQWKLQQPLLAQAVSQLQGGGFQNGGQAPATPSQPAIPPTSGGAMGSGTFGIPMGGQQQSAPQQPAQGGRSMLPGVPNNVAMWNIATGGVGSIPALLNEYNKPTDFQKMLTAAGIDPSSPQGQQLIAQNLAKQNYVAPVNARPGSILRDPRTNMPIAFNPHVPDGSTPTFDASGNVVGLRPLSGAYQAISNAEAAKGLGQGEATPTVAYDASGNPIFSTKANDVRRAGGGLPGGPAGMPPVDPTAQPGVTGNFRGDPGELAAIIGGLKDPQERANAMAALQEQASRSGAGPLTPQQRPGLVQGAQLSQDELSKKGAGLMSDNAQTNTVISRLQNIKMLAPGAITGAETSRRDFFNGLLSLGGITGATDAKTASDLVDKNANQIVTALRMGQGGAGTDALQALLGAANPNRHMTVGAINEAVDQLIASQKMVQAKTQMLQPAYLARDPVQYGKKELVFDRNADPRIWQLEAMPPQQQASYVKSLPPQVAADMLQKRKALRDIGALK